MSNTQFLLGDRDSLSNKDGSFSSGEKLTSDDMEYGIRGKMSLSRKVVFKLVLIF